MSEPRRTIIRGDARRIPLRDGSVHCVVTSPPYFGLRDYSCDQQIGLEESPDAYVASLVGVFREVWRVLRDDGVCWLNLGDSFCNAGSRNNGTGLDEKRRGGMRDTDGTWAAARDSYGDMRNGFPESGIKKKDLIGIPWRCALALQRDGWWLRSAPPWIKRNGMPDSTEDRPGTSHEYVFLLTKSSTYYYDCDAVRKLSVQPKRAGKLERSFSTSDPTSTFRKDVGQSVMRTIDRNRRTGDWFREGLDELIAFHTEYLDHLRHIRAKGGLMLDESGDPAAFLLATEPSSLPHYAMMPQRLVEPCILSGTSQAGACAACGAPWERIIEKTSTVRPVDYNGKNVHTAEQSASRRMLANTRARRNSGESHEIPFPAPTTIGWQPTCSCDAGPPVPCTVLDPFSGMATTGIVSAALGCHYIGVELNAADAALSLRRLERPHDPSLLRSRASNRHDPLPGQQSFLDSLSDDPEPAPPEPRKRKPPKPLEGERKLCNRCNAPLDAAAGACPECGCFEFRLVPES